MSEYEELKARLFNKKECGWENLREEEKTKIDTFGNEYIYFLNKCKTEREAVEFSKEILQKNGFVDLREKPTLMPGDKVYYINRAKSVYVAVIGTDTLETGLNIVGAHIDSPRLDLKPNPLYEDSGFAYFKTHYYGGIKKYQWTTIPLSIHGVIVKTTGEKIRINIGEDEAAKVLGKNKEDINIISCHLGNGSSIAAVKNGKCVETSMGLTPLEGLVMGTRSGDLDPAILEFIMKKENLNIDEMMTILNKKSGLLGITGITGDVRDLKELRERKKILQN